MADEYNRKPEPLEPDAPGEDDGLYELAEDPDDAKPAPPPPPPGLRDQPDPVTTPDPMADDDRDAGLTMKTGDGGKGAASHFSGEDPEYVNPEIARMRREEARIAAAEEEAQAAARKRKFVLITVAALVLLAVAAYFALG